MRDSTIIYRSFFEAIKELPKENQADLWNAICEFTLNFNEVELTGINKTIFTLIHPSLKILNRNFKNGSTPKNKREGSEKEAKPKPKGSETEAYKDKDKDKDIKEREKAFINALAPFVEMYGKVMIRAFFEYWSEKTKSGKKMKFELNKTWELSKRLATWASRENDFASNKQNNNKISTFDDGSACCQ